MEESGKDSLDGSSIKPVSSLRSHFEQMSISHSTSGILSLKPAINGSKSLSYNLVPDSAQLESNRTENQYSIPPRLVRDLEHGIDGKPKSRDAESNLTFSSKIVKQRPPPCPPPPIDTQRHQGSSGSKIMSLKIPTDSPNPSGTPKLGISPSRNLRIPPRPRTPSIESERHSRKISSKPPSPPPPRRSSENRQNTSNQPDKPKINTKPVSVVLRAGKTGMELGSARSTSDKISPFISPYSSDDTKESSSPNLPNMHALGLMESNGKSFKSLAHSHQHPNASLMVENYSGIEPVRNKVFLQVTGDETPPPPARSPAQTDPLKLLHTQKSSSRSKSSMTSTSGTAHLRVLSSPSPTHGPPCERRRSLTVYRSSDRIPVSLCTSIITHSSDSSSDTKFLAKKLLEPVQNQFPDLSHSNRRPPYMKNGVRDISTKYDTRIMDICGEYVCTSGNLTRVWSILNGEIIASFANTEGVKVTSVAFKPAIDVNDEGLKLWMGNNVGDIQEVDIFSQNLTITKSNAHNRREIIKIYQHHRDMWTLDNGGTLNMWTSDVIGLISLQDYVQSFRLPKGHTFSIINGNELWFATGRDIRIYIPTVDDSARFEVLQSPLNQPNTGDITSGTTIKTQPERIYFGHADGKVSIYSNKNYTCLGVVVISIHKITSMAGIAGNIWAGFSTGMVFIYDVQKSPWIVKKDWSAHQGPITKMISDPSSCWLLDRAQVVTLGQDNMIRLWDGFLEDDFIESQMHSHEADFCESNKISTLIMTWNAGASTPYSLQQCDQDATFFRDLIRNSDCPDILVFGFQELVDLEDKKTVTKSFFKSKKKDSSVHEHMSHRYRDWRDFLTRCLDDYMPRDELYHLLHTSSLVGLFTCVFVKAPMIERIRCLSSAEIKRGLGGLHGNKGALIIRFVLDDTSFCFVNCHLAAGQTATKDRNADITAILDTPALPPEADRNVRLNSYVGGGDGTMILDHEICIINGDLNYRIDTMSRDTVITAVRTKNMTKLLERDQLLASKRKNPWFILRTFQELPINFAPTYKYDIGTDTYDSSDKKRSPAWCDRILYRGGDRIAQLDYRRHEVRVSDHRPVTGCFQIFVKKILQSKRAIMWNEVQNQKSRRKIKLVNDAMQEYLINIIGYDAVLINDMIKKSRDR